VLLSEAVESQHGNVVTSTGSGLIAQVLGGYGCFPLSKSSKCVCVFVEVEGELVSTDESDLNMLPDHTPNRPPNATPITQNKSPKPLPQAGKRASVIGLMEQVKGRTGCK